MARCRFRGGLFWRRRTCCDYLAAHEVAHLVEMNHSRKFWRILRELCPEMNIHKVWLDVHGGDLHRYGSDCA